MTTSDCGCKGTGGVGPAHGGPATTSARTEPTSPGVAAASRGAGAANVQGFRALNPSDGLFLRAEHLHTIQDYGRSLNQALATATGPGIVHGLGVSLEGTVLTVTPGLAISFHGRLLRLASPLTMALTPDELPTLESPGGATGFWRVELGWESETSGSAPVYGSLCNDGCGDGANIQPWRDEGVSVQLVPDHLVYPATHPRSGLASAYFERERANGGPWLVPGKDDSGKVAPLLPRPWEDGTPLPPEQGVTLALLQPVGGGYVLDVWAARRLVDAPPSDHAWQSRLAMRPWPVFLAQVLQFQDELADILPKDTKGASTSPRDTVRSEKIRTIRNALEGLNERTKLRSGPEYPIVMEAVAYIEGDGQQWPEVPVFTELPPAGYLPVSGTAKDFRSQVQRFLGEDRVDLTYRDLRADQIADEVLAAQHRDRIPLRERHGDRLPKVDILIPSEPADKKELHAQDYGWVAFVRSAPGPESPDPGKQPMEEVPVFFFLTRGDNWHSLGDDHVRNEIINAEGGDSFEKRELGTLHYPQESWQYPGREVAEATRKYLEDLRARGEVELLGLIAATTDDGPLAALRASLFGASLGMGAPLPVYSGVSGTDAIIVVAFVPFNR